ncbi:hypothetical protein AVEN_135433-1 [Araneus ventricosus]|uniref:Uncharacterized protein n=1 Tax=Araneus ventricosus TaxID=182803 RepID=A0A4Y2BDH7_ARAVE|nr:hypothetical protein AVEN_135433-1 [Araneus ventricosus]
MDQKISSLVSEKPLIRRAGLEQGIQLRKCLPHSNNQSTLTAFLVTEVSQQQLVVGQPLSTGQYSLHNNAAFLSTLLRQTLPGTAKCGRNYSPVASLSPGPGFNLGYFLHIS